MKVTLTKTGSIPQAEFVNANDQFPAFVAGFGSGKTQAAIGRALRLKFRYPGQNIADYFPTYDLVRMIGYPRFSEELENARVPFKLNKAEHVISIPGKGQLIFRTLDNPARIVGYEVADSLVDELDTLKRNDAEHAWRQIIARNRQKKPDGALNTVAVATTPEGFRFVYERWQKDPTEGYRLIRASTYSNSRNLPDGYIDSLKRSYPPQLIEAYLEGRFVNLTSGAVYPDFLRIMNGTAAEILPGEPLHIGLDFNVYNCTAVVGVIRDGKLLVLGELTKMRDTPHVIDTIRATYPGHKITVYPDASGSSNRTVNASESDLLLLKAAGFSLVVPNKNPFIKERVMAVNAQILNAVGERRLMINAAKAPRLVECLEQQIYDPNGLPDKSSDNDHGPDAIGYLINALWPIARPVAAKTRPIFHMAR